MGRLFGLSDSGGTMSSFIGYVDITLIHSGALTAFQKDLTIAYQTGMQANFNDIRFNIWNGTEWEYVSYWLESKTDLTTAEVYIKNDYDSGNTVVRMYYGNDNLSSGSNIYDTLEAGSDTFYDLNTAYWTVGLGAPTVVGGELILDPNEAVYNKGYVPNDVIVEMRVRQTSTDSLSFGGPTNVFGDLSYTAADAYNFQWWASNNLVSNSFDEGNRTFTNNITRYGTSYSIFKMVKNGATDIKYYTDDVLRITESSNIPTDSDMAVQFFHYTTGNGVMVIDWCKVRKYTSVEPTYTISEPHYKRREPQFIS